MEGWSHVSHSAWGNCRTPRPWPSKKLQRLKTLAIFPSSCLSHSSQGSNKREKCLDLQLDWCKNVCCWLSDWSLHRLHYFFSRFEPPHCIVKVYHGVSSWPFSSKSNSATHNAKLHKSIFSERSIAHVPPPLKLAFLEPNGNGSRHWHPGEHPKKPYKKTAVSSQKATLAYLGFDPPPCPH